MKDILNEKIKHRESFRPFAPSIMEEYVAEYFDIDRISPYMLFVAPVKKPAIIPAVTHVDGTGRLQSVNRNANPLYYQLINEFYKITGVPVIINTSMNVMGEPIVNTPKQAYQMILKTDMDILIMGNYLVKNNVSSNWRWKTNTFYYDFTFNCFSNKWRYSQILLLEIQDKCKSQTTKVYYNEYSKELVERLCADLKNLKYLDSTIRTNFPNQSTLTYSINEHGFRGESIDLVKPGWWI